MEGKMDSFPAGWIYGVYILYSLKASKGCSIHWNVSTTGRNLSAFEMSVDVPPALCYLLMAAYEFPISVIDTQTEQTKQNPRVVVQLLLKVNAVMTLERLIHLGRWIYNGNEDLSGDGYHTIHQLFRP